MSCLHLHDIPQDSGTGVGKLMCTGYFKDFWEVDMQVDNSTTPSKWEITSATLLAKGFGKLATGFSFIPSGSYKNNIVWADWSNDTINMMTFDDSGRPVTNILTPEITTFIEDFVSPQGVFFDPKVWNNCVPLLI